MVLGPFQDALHGKRIISALVFTLSICGCVTPEIETHAGFFQHPTAKPPDLHLEN